MENTPLTSDVWYNVTVSSSVVDDMTGHTALIRSVPLKVVYILMGTIGVLDNLFVIVVFALFIKITDKVHIDHLKALISPLLDYERWARS